MIWIIASLPSIVFYSKNGETRTVPLTQDLAAALQKLKDDRKPAVSDRVFLYQSKPWACWKEAFNGAAERAGLKDFHFHDLTERSGKTIWVHRRLACPKFVLQTFHEFANQSRKFCVWSKLYYQKQRARGKQHNAAVRALAYKWIRILFRCWKDRQPYEDSRHTKSLIKRGASLAQQLGNTTVRGMKVRSYSPPT